MAALRELRTKIKSVKSVRKITHAMQMVSASKMRKAQDRMLTSRPYSEKILDVIQHLANAQPQYRHAYMVTREVKRVGFIIITSDRGLCGALNSNILRLCDSKIKHWAQQDVEADLCLIGNKADTFFRKGGSVIAKANHIGDDGGVDQLIGAVKVMLDAYKERRIDALYLSFNRFVNTMVQKPVIQQLLPVLPAATQHKHVWDYIYEPSPVALLDPLLNRYIESQVYQSAVESIACEHAARMVAMKNASDNATQLIDQFQLSCNKARQAAITNEITEIVSGVQGMR